MFFCYTCCSLVGVGLQEIPVIKVSVRLGLTDCSVRSAASQADVVDNVKSCLLWKLMEARVVFIYCDQLPVKIDIIKHPNETDGKSTAIHAKILAPADVTIYTYPCIPEFEKDKVGSL